MEALNRIYSNLNHYQNFLAQLDQQRMSGNGGTMNM